MDWLQHVRSESTRVEDRHAEISDWGKVDRRAANRTAASFSSGSARLYGARLPPHVRRHERGRDAKAADLRRLERWRTIRRTRQQCWMELDTRRQKYRGRRNERLERRSQLSERQPLCSRRNERWHAATHHTRRRVDRACDFSE